MGTRAIYTFKKQNSLTHIYSHWDNDPEGAAQKFMLANKVYKESENVTSDLHFAVNKYSIATNATILELFMKTNAFEIVSSANEVTWLDYKYFIDLLDLESAPIIQVEKANYDKDLFEIIYKGHLWNWVVTNIKGDEEAYYCLPD